MRQEILTRWVPKGIKVTDILNIIHEYGLDNDTLAEEEYDDNIVPYNITIIVQKKLNTD